jgi:putative molybdopterin biosynthesis protein
VKTSVLNRLGLIRKRRGMATSDLARKAGVTRQAIHAIETGEYVPNTEVALRLARELDVSVNDLFALPQGLEKSSESLSVDYVSETPPQRGQPVKICKVGSRWVSVPVSASPYYLPEADGVVQWSRARRRADLIVFDKDEASQKRLIMAGCDPATVC